MTEIRNTTRTRSTKGEYVKKDYDGNVFVFTEGKSKLEGAFDGGILWVHGVESYRMHFLKDCMRALCKHYKARKTIFAPLTTMELPRKVRGGLVMMCRKTNVENFMGFDFEFLTCNWED